MKQSINKTKPLIIEFLGMPRAGKTTQIKLLKKHLETQGKRVHIISDRECAKSAQTPVEEYVGFNLVMFALMLEEYFKHKDLVDVILFDRGFNDRQIWFDVKKRIRKISNKRAAELQKTFSEYEPLADKIICMMVDPKTAIARHQNTKHMKVDDFALSLPWLKALDSSYRAHRKTFKKSLWLDGKNNPQDIHKKIATFVKNTFER